MGKQHWLTTKKYVAQLSIWAVFQRKYSNNPELETQIECAEAKSKHS